MKIIVHRRTKPRELFILSGVFLLLGLALVGIATLFPPPPLASIPSITGKLQGVQWQYTRGANRLMLGINGDTYYCKGSDIELKSLEGTLRPNDDLQVWALRVPNGGYEVWQLARGSQILIGYGTRAQRQLQSDRNAAIMGEVVVGFGFLIGLLGMAARVYNSNSQ